MLAVNLIEIVNEFTLASTVESTEGRICKFSGVIRR